MQPIFRNRREAGQRLARAVAEQGCPGENLLIIGLPRGGVVVAAEVARGLRAPLEVIIPRRLRSPANPELAVGAVVRGDPVPLFEEELLRATGAEAAYLEQEIREQREESERRGRLYRGDRPFPDLRGRTVIVIDDGIATGLTLRAALQALRRQGAARLIAAAPVAPQASLEAVRGLADGVVCLATPEPFLTVSVWYQEFGQHSDAEVIALLQPGATDDEPTATDDDRDPHPLARGRSSSVVRPVMIPAGAARLLGTLEVPADARGMVVFAHGAGSSHDSPRHRFVAGMLREAGFATLRFDLLEAHEAANRGSVFDVDLLAGRLLDVTAWVREQPGTRHLPVCYLGASTGAAAALQAAARSPVGVAAVASRGGRPDLAAASLPHVTAPTLLIVGGNDEPVMALNQAARGLLGGPNEMVVVPGAGHVFEEPGTLEKAAVLARDWFLRCLQEGLGIEETPTKRTIAIALTREQQLAVAAATGVLVGVLELDPEALASGELPWGQIPGLG
jgi:putative phosphoribosyl transferase